MAHRPVCSREDSPAEEVASAATHGLGTLLAIVGLVLLVVATASRGDALRLVTATTFGVCLVAVYLASTLLHAVRHPRLRSILLECDHVSIFLLIAATYTPLMLVAVGGGWGWSVAGVVWTLAALGIAIRLTCRDRLFGLRTALYVVTGWSGVIAAAPMIQALSPQGFALVIAGGVAYTVGVGFFLWRRLPFNHAIWHVFVIAGSACHFAAIWSEVVQPPTLAG